jgi:hypothetical protein
VCGAPSLGHSTPTIKHQFYQFCLTPLTIEVYIYIYIYITLTFGDLFIPKSQSRAKHICFLCVKSHVQIPAPKLSTSTEDFTVLLSPSSGGVVVKVLRYKPAGRGFDSWWCNWNFSVM